MMSEFDPWAHASPSELERWRSYEAELRDSVAIQISGGSFLENLPGYSDKSGQATTSALIEAQSLVAAVFVESVVDVATEKGIPLEAKQGTYVPPIGYGKAGGNGITDILLEWIPTTGDLRGAYVSWLVSSAVPIAIARLREIWDHLSVRLSDRHLPRFHPTLVAGACSLHAMKYSEIGNPADTEMFPKTALDANYPYKRHPLVIVVGCEGGQMHYSVTNRLEIVTILEITAEGSREIDCSSWNEMYGVGDR